MLALSLRSTITALLRHPLFWGAALATGLLVPLVVALNPWADAARLTQLATLPAGLLGAALALHLTDHKSNILHFSAPGGHLCFEWVAVATGALAVQLALLPAQLALAHDTLPTTGAVVGVILLDLHVAALGVLALRFPLPAPWRPFLFATILWVAAGDLLPGRVGTLLALAAPVLDVSHHIPSDPAFDGGLLAASLAAGPIAGLLLASRLLLARSQARAGFAPSR